MGAGEPHRSRPRPDGAGGPPPYADRVEGLNGLVVLLAGGLGLLTGIGAMLAFRWSDREQHAMPPQPAPELDDGLVRVLAVLRSAAVVLDDDERVVRASPPAYALGVVQDGVIAHASVRDLIADVRRAGVIRDEELELPRGPLGPGTVMLQVRVAQVGPGQLLVLAEDRTQARRLEAIRRDFVVNVSHELKTPVGALSLLAETVQDAADDPAAVRRFAGRMLNEAQRLSALVHEILELSRLQVAGALKDIVVVDLDAVVAESVDRARTGAAAKQMSFDVGGEKGAQVFGDHTMLVQAVRNLLDNAVAYSPEGTHVGVGLRTHEGLVEVAVVDQGVGIPADEQDRVFERFYRVDPARSRDTGGTGLGLSIVKHVAADHGGDVQVWSQPGRGSTFTLRLPIAAGPTRSGPALSGPTDHADPVDHRQDASPDLPDLPAPPTAGTRPARPHPTPEA